MSKEVKRYDCTDGGALFCQGCYTMSECEFGEYVSWDDYEALLAERDALEKDAVRFREIVAAVVREHPRRSANRGNAPGHGHSVPGVWDSDNGALAGTECAWCKTWNEAIAALQGAQP